MRRELESIGDSATSQLIEARRPVSMWTTAAFLVSFLLLYDGVTSIFFQTRQTGSRCQRGLGMSSSEVFGITRGREDMTGFQTDLNAILRPRLPGTSEHTQVREYIKSRMNALGWTVGEDSFIDNTPRGPTRFTNIIATQNSSAARRIVVACHYDSKYFRDFVFLGATDSAVPCALMIDSASKIQDFLPQTTLRLLQDMTFQFIFFDGEEAFERWNSTDSLYGSRHLASMWKFQPDRNDPTATNYLQNINVFILLDLIGTRDTNIRRPYGDRTAVALFTALSRIESCLRSKRWLQLPYNRIFQPWAYAQMVEDDHIPFLREGVQTLHLISTPFPRVWHRSSDNSQNLDSSLIQNFASILRVFLTELITQN